MVRCVLDGKDFMGQPTLKGPVVYLTEEHDSTFREALGRAGLLGHADLHVLSYGEAWGVAWPMIMVSAVEQWLAVGAKLLVVDTFPQFAGLVGDNENSAGHVLQAFQPLRWAADQGSAVIAVRHELKSGAGSAIRPGAAMPSPLRPTSSSRFDGPRGTGERRSANCTRCLDSVARRRS